MDEDGLWKRVLIEKYGIQDVWRLNEIRSPFGRSLLKGIFQHLEVYKKCIACEVGKGEGIAFWEDVWCGDSSLKMVCSQTYSKWLKPYGVGGGLWNFPLIG